VGLKKLEPPSTPSIIFLIASNDVYLTSALKHLELANGHLVCLQDDSRRDRQFRSNSSTSFSTFQLLLHHVDDI